MKLPFTKAENVSQPLEGYGFAFVDIEDKKLKIKKYDSVIEFTNDLSDTQLLDLTDYTAFEVLPHTELIPSGSVISGTILAGNIKDTQVLSSILNNDIPANTIQKIKIRTMQPDYSKSDVVIDWGDGCFSSIKNQNFINSSIDEVTYEGDYIFEHDYAESLAKDGVTNKRFIIKIYGKQYYNFNFLSTADNSNLMCRVFEVDLPIASHIGNIAQFCYWAKNLVYVSCECIKYRRFENCQGLFNGASNLVKVIGMESNFSYAMCATMFSSCSSLIYTDFKMPLNGLRTSLIQIFNNCPKLVMDVSELFPTMYNNYGDIDIKRLFKWCSGLTLSDDNLPALAKILWNNKNINWLNTSDVFGGCSAELRAKIPTSWGGTASDDIIE